MNSVKSNAKTKKRDEKKSFDSCTKIALSLS